MLWFANVVDDIENAQKICGKRRKLQGYKVDGGGGGGGGETERLASNRCLTLSRQGYLTEAESKGN